MAGTGAAVRLRGLRKSYGGTDALAGIDLDVRHGEFFSLLGPSGSGKTTTLRLIAGFEEPTDGSVELAGQDVTGLAPYERDVHTVFQDYALFPHMTVEQNVGYALKVRGTPRAERAEGCGPRWPRCGWKGTAGAGPRSCPAVSGNGWRWPAP